MIDLPSLYDHQETIRDHTRLALARHRRVILCAAPGVGKTRTAKWILGSSANRKPSENQSGHSLFSVHRRGLVDNAVNSFAEHPKLPHGVIMSGRDTAYGNRIQVASIDSLLSWFIEEDAYYPDITFDLLVYDEAHSHHPKFARFMNYHDARREELGLHPAYVIGLTATPQAQGLADVYKEIVLGPETQWLIDNQYLSPFRYFRATQGNLGLLVKRGGEFTKNSVAAAMEGLSGDLVRDWKKHAEGRPTVGFFPRRSQAKEAAMQLEAAGLRVDYVDGNTKDEERRRMFRALNNHDIDYLCNVQVIERGTDIPAIACVQVCVAVASLVRWRQLIGRGSRVHEGKKDCLILDHGGNLKRGLGFFEDDPSWSLDITTKDPGEAGVRPTIECPKCNAIYRGGKCRHCGYEPTPRERKAQGLEFDGSELKEFKRIEDKVKERNAKEKSAEQMMVSALYKAGHSGRTWKQAVGIYKRLCEQQGTPHHVPKTVTVGGHRYNMIRYGSEDANRRVSALYSFTTGDGHGGDYESRPLVNSTTPY